MVTATILQRGSISVIDYRCDAGPADKPFVELHDGFSVSYVRKGSFGYRLRGESFELVAGAILIGHPGDEFICTHDHHVCGDECLSFRVTPALIETIGARTELWRIGALPPLPELMVLGELAQAAAEGKNTVGLDEAAMLFTARFVDVVSGRKRKPHQPRAADRRRAVEAALWTDAHSDQPIRSESAAHESGPQLVSLSARVRQCARVTHISIWSAPVLRHAARLWPTALGPITDIAFDVSSPTCPTSSAPFIGQPAYRAGRFREAAKATQDFQDRLAALS
jgi:hypothetical protein